MTKNFSKFRKLRAKNIAIKGDQLNYGFIGLKALESGKITKQQIEAVRVAISRALARQGKLTIRANTFFPVTKKALGVRMGGGKGAIDKMVCPIPAGKILFELANTTRDLAVNALNKAVHKLNIKCKIVERRFYCSNS